MGGRGQFLTQLVRVTEYWYLSTSILAFFGEALHGKMLTDNSANSGNNDESHPLTLMLDAFRHNQDSGIDDWTRLLVHSIFLNCIDEIQHFSSSTNPQSADDIGTARRQSEEEGRVEEGTVALVDQQQTYGGTRRRAGQ